MFRKSRVNDGCVPILLILFIVVFFFVVYKIRDFRCDTMTQTMGKEGHYSFVSGCMINVEDDIWIPITNYKYMAPDN